MKESKSMTMTDFDGSKQDVREQIEQLKIAQATQTAAQAGFEATQAAVQAGTASTTAASLGGLAGSMAAGAAGLITGLFLGLAIAAVRRP